MVRSQRPPVTRNRCAWRVQSPILSPDGKRLALQPRRRNLWILDLTRGIASKFTSGPGLGPHPSGRRRRHHSVLRNTLANGVPGGIYEKNASGAVDERLFFKGAVNGPSQVSPDGKWLLYFANSAGESVQDVYVLPMTGERKPQRIVQSPAADVEPQFSPAASTSRTRLRRPANTKSTCSRFRRLVKGGPSPTTAAGSQCGGRMVKESSSSVTPKNSTE